MIQKMVFVCFLQKMVAPVELLEPAFHAASEKKLERGRGAGKEPLRLPKGRDQGALGLAGLRLLGNKKPERLDHLMNFRDYKIQ